LLIIYTLFILDFGYYSSSLVLLSNHCTDMNYTY
jgi:hypothetical protein